MVILAARFAKNIGCIVSFVASVSRQEQQEELKKDEENLEMTFR